MIAEAVPIEVIYLFTHLNNPKLIKSNHIHTDMKQMYINPSVTSVHVYYLVNRSGGNGV